MLKTLYFGSEVIDYSLEYVDRKTLGITVNPDRSVDVRAPLNSEVSKIETKLRKRAPWILKQKDFFLSFEPRTPERQYVSGETHLYLGRQYQLKVISSEKEFVKYSGRYIEVHTKSKEREYVAQLLNKWYSERAKYWFGKLLPSFIERFKKYKVAPQKIELKNMQYRWGSCSSYGRILLNPLLIQAPKPCIEYVVVHELCHLVYRDHTQPFFALQAREMPDWEKWKMKLEQVMS